MEKDLEALKAAAIKEWGHEGHWIAEDDKYIWTWASGGPIAISFTATFLSKNDLGLKIWSVFINGEDVCADSSLDLEFLFHELKVNLVRSLMDKFGVEEDL